MTPQFTNEVIMDYTNWKGSRRERRIIPLDMFIGSSEFHPQEQWLMKAIDLEDNVVKSFAMSGLHGWRSVEGNHGS